MARKVIDIIYNLVRRRLAQSGAYDRGPGITSLPNSMDVEAGMQQIFKQLREGGLNPVSADKVIKNEEDLLRVIEEINQKKIAKAKARQKAAEGIERVFDKMRRNIPLNPDDQAALQGSGFKTTLDNFKGFEPKVIPGGKKPRDKKSKGGVINAIKNLLKKSKPKKSGDKIYGVGGEEMDVADLKKSLGLDEATDKKSMEDLEKKLQMIIGRDRTKHSKGGLAGVVKKLQKKFGKDIIQKGKAPKKSKKRELREMIEGFKERNMAGGGVAHMLGEPREEMAAGGVPLRRLLQFLAGRKKGSQSLKEMKLPDQVKFFAEKQGFNPDQARIEYLEQVLESLKADRKLIKGLEPSPDKMDIEKQADELFRKTYVDETQGGRFEGLSSEAIDSSIMELETILKNLKTKGRKLNADGGRIGFADGGMSRRTFLKIMAALAAFPVVGKLAKTTKVAKGVAPIVTPTAEMPAHFPKLVEKIIREGQVVKKDFVKKTGDVTTYRHPDRPDIELTIEGEGNRIQLDFDTDQGMKAGYEFRKGDIIDDPASSMRGKRGPNEFVQGEVKYRGDTEGNYYKDFEEGIETGTENLDEFAGISKQKTSKSKTVSPDAYDDLGVPDEDLAEGGLAGLLGE
jgi:hypothetical protein